MPMKLVLMFGLGGHIHRDNHDCKSNGAVQSPTAFQVSGLDLLPVWMYARCPHLTALASTGSNQA